ncbi:MAG: nicotinate-nucleotide adenylyltransferase [Blastocatellia bacterium]|jgi:nicotinate-nucleotide adenylyltransferase|nr:nicotinate-nucleotide adenylyltransferase [Blastocatellia bacterium]
MMALQRVAIYGGTFDPVHKGHVAVARTVLQLFELDEVLFVPAFVPPHKRNAKVTSPFHRFAMLSLATEDDKQLRISTSDLDVPDEPYAVETVARIRSVVGNDTELFFLMGADSWLEIKSWHDWRRLMGLCHFIVMTRPGYELSGAAMADMPIPALNVREVMRMHYQRPQAFMTDAVMMDISATAIRIAARAGESQRLREMVPDPVANYIEKYGLYQN